MTREVFKAGIASEKGKEWIFDRYIDAEINSDIDGIEAATMEYEEFSQALSNANDPAFPHFETEAETDAAYEAAWDEYCRLFPLK